MDKSVKLVIKHNEMNGSYIEESVTARLWMVETLI